MPGKDDAGSVVYEGELGDANQTNPGAACFDPRPIRGSSGSPRASASTAGWHAQDIRGSIAHARMLASVGVLTADEAEQIVAGLEHIGAEIAAGTFVFRQELEDIHMNIERALIDRLGDVGRKLHTGRSRNDQVSTDLRLWIRDAIDRLDGLLAGVQRAFVGRATATPASSCRATRTCSGRSRCWPPITGWRIARSSAGPRAAGRLPPAGEPARPGNGGAGRDDASRSTAHDVAERLGLRGRRGEQPRCRPATAISRSSSRSRWR